MIKGRLLGKRRPRVMPQAGRPHTRLDKNFDRMRAILTRNGVTLESAMQTLGEMRRQERDRQERDRQERDRQRR